MSPQLTSDRVLRGSESLEERLALTGQSIADLPELIQFAGIETSFSESITTSMDSGNDIQYVRNNYGFDGSGQTVAIIDSGIAWDHYALGGGLGEDFRVVGGWDFAENDSDPFDDGPAGFHGTHVAGIVASDDVTQEGVASGVDLVGLRVFDDRGNGKLEWVEQALQWVHDHRNEFENPITTVNLSLGTNWNSDNIPGWANLEDEFAQLETDGIFISVAAGNSFQKYQTSGVSYPAASPSVVPVASHGDDGQLSDFSQRNNRVLVAPGENISSTIPAHLYGQTGPSYQFMATSGTSMAAPYVAGASVLLRQAFDLAGQTELSQDDLYEHFQRTADQIYDQFTGSWYSRLDLKSAIDAALEDGHGNSVGRATQLGAVGNVGTIEGILAKSNDVDYFRFEAEQSGLVTLDYDASHDLQLKISAVGKSFNRVGNRITFEVVKGEEYFLRLASESGQGNYKVNVAFESNTPSTQNLGVVRSEHFSGLKLSRSGEAFFQVAASRQGLLTIEALHSQTENGSLRLEVIDSSGNTLQLGSRNSEGVRVDLNAKAGQSFLVKLSGSIESFELKATNLIRTIGNRVIVGGTGQSDSYQYESSSSNHELTVNGTSYEFSKATLGKVRIHGGTGDDAIRLIGSDSQETLSGGSGNVVFFGSETDVISRNFETISVDGKGGNDLAVINDTAASDFFRATPEEAELVGGGYRLSTNGFSRVTVVSRNGGLDRADLIGSSQRDLLHIHQDGTSISGAGFQNYLIGFEEVDVSGNGGSDRVVARGTDAQESFTVEPGIMRYTNQMGQIDFGGFASVMIHSGGGNDVATFDGLNRNDSLNEREQSVEGIVFGSEISIENFRTVEWNDSTIDNRTDVDALDHIFGNYAE